MAFQSSDDRWYGARFAESVDDDMELVMGRILRDLRADRAKGNALFRNAVFSIALVGRAIHVTVFVRSDASTNRKLIRERVSVFGDRYNWVGKTNQADVRFRLEVTVSEVRASVINQVRGNMIG